MNTINAEAELSSGPGKSTLVQTESGMNNEKEVLAVKDLNLSFFIPEGEVRALCDVNLKLNQGDTLGLVGEAGSGKSVLIYSILNAVKKPGKIMKGEVIFKGQNLLEMPTDELRKIRGNRIGVMVSHPKSALNPLEQIGTQIENAYLAHQNASREEAREAAIQALRSVGINDPERRITALPQELSGGMAQRVIVAIGLLHSPELLLADEPTAGVDVTIQRQILEMMNDLIKSRNMATIIASRDIGIMTHYSKTIAVLQHGYIVEMGSVNTIYHKAWHPYTIKLLKAVTFGKVQLDDQDIVTSSISQEKKTTSHFCDICKDGNHICENATLLEVSTGHWVRCHG